MGWLTERQVGRGRIPGGAYKQACRCSIGPLPSIGLPGLSPLQEYITYTFPTVCPVSHREPCPKPNGRSESELVGPSRERDSTLCQSPLEPMVPSPRRSMFPTVLFSSCPFPPLSNSPFRQLNTIKKCICQWNVPDPFTLIIITTNVSPGPSQCIDIDIIDSTPQRSVYLSKKDINAETRFAVTPRRGRGLCVL